MPVTDEFLQYVMDQLSEWGGVTIRKMFGGAGLYRDGRMFGLVADDVAYLKVNDSNRGEYEKAGSSPFKPYSSRNMIMPYYEIPADIMEQPDELIEWAKRSLAISVKK